MDKYLDNMMSRRHVVSLAVGGVTAALMGFNSESAYAASTKYPIVYNLGGGKQASGQKTTIKSGATIPVEKLLAPKRKGYTFTGWYKDKNHERALVALKGVKKETSRTACAGWKKIAYYISYDHNDNLGTTSSKKYYVTSAFKLEKPTRKGWAFAGWFTEKDPNIAVTEIVKGTTGNKALIAKWEMKSYWKTYLETMIPKINEKCAAVAGHGDSLLFITDYHVPSNNLTAAAAIQEIYEKTDVKKIVNGGDLINFSLDKNEALEIIKGWTSNMCFADVWSVRGNHDNNDQYGSNEVPEETRFTDKEVCEMLFPHLLDEEGEVIETIPEETIDVPGLVDASEYEGMTFSTMLATPTTTTILNISGILPEDRDVVRPKGDGDHALCYVKDNEESRIRYIFLDTGHPNPAIMEDEQLIWMQRRIVELPEGWTVLIFQHQLFSSEYMDANGIAIMRAIDGIYGKCAATIAGVVSGHVHADLAYKSPKGYVLVSTVSDARSKTRSIVKTLSPRGTGVDLQAFDIIHIDTEARTLYFQRMGYGDDRFFTY